MSTKTTFKRIALVAVAALGFGVLSVVPSSATVAGATVTVSNGAATELLADSTTAATITIGWTATAGLTDSFTAQVAYRAANPAAATAVAPKILYSDSSTSIATKNPVVDTTTVGSAADTTKHFLKGANIAFDTALTIRAGDGAGITNSVIFKLYLGETGTTKVVAGTYRFNVITTIASVVTITPVDIVVAAAPVAATPVPSAANAKAYIQAQKADGTAPTFTGVLADSATSGSLVAGTTIGQIKVNNFTIADAAASDTITVAMTGVGYLTTVAPSTVVTGRSFTILNEDELLMNVIADGSSGTGTITITTEKGAKFVKTVTFFDTKPTKATATVAKAFIKAGTASVAEVFEVVVTDGSGNAVTNAVVTAAPTDTATTVGGAATCAWDATVSKYECAVAGKAADKFGPVAYTITATGADAAKTAVKTTATVTFADNVATKAVLAGPASGTPGATVEYTLTLTEKNGYPVADQTYGAGGLGGALFAKSVVSGWSATGPFLTTESFTSVSGVITSKGVLPIAGVATGTWTLVGDGLQTLAANAIDKTIGKTTVTVTTDVANPGVDAATDAANEATDAANAATDAALAAAEAADAATTAAQEASDAVAALSASVTKLIEGLQAQIKSLAAVVAKIAKKVKA